MPEPELPENLFQFPDAQTRLAAIATWFDQRQNTGRAKDTDSTAAAHYTALAYLADIAESLRKIAHR